MPTTTAPHAPTLILVSTDFSDASTEAIATARAYAAGRVRAVIHVIHVMQGTVGPDPLDAFAVQATGTLLGQQLEDARVRLRATTEEQLRGSGVDVVGHLRIGVPAREVVALARELSADVVIVGSHGRHGVERLLLGSVAEKIVRDAPCTVVVARPKAASTDVAIEPPCPACLDVRRASNGGSPWCARHSEHHPRAHTYSQLPAGFGSGWQTFRIGGT